MSNLTGQNVFAAGNYQIGGGTANQSATLFDGVPVNISYGNSVELVPSQDVVSEFRVQTNSNTVEYGAYTGGVVNISSKSGTNVFHGTAYEFLRNRVLNATSFFANSTGAGSPAYTQNQFGIALGGPVVIPRVYNGKNRTFFFAGYEGYRQRQGSLVQSTLPTAALLQGDFSNYRNASGALIPIYDPLTNCGQMSNAACGTSTIQRTVFPGNIISASRLNPVALALIKWPVFGTPNLPGTQYTQLLNFAENVATGGSNDQVNFRVDQNLSDKQRIFARFSRWNSAILPVYPYNNYLDSGAPEQFVTTQAVLADTYTISPTLIADVRASYMRWYYNRIPGDTGADDTKFGLPSYYNQIAVGDGFTGVTTLPRLTVAPYTVLGTGRIFSANNNYVLSGTLTKIFSRHSLKFGADVRRLDENYFQNNNPSGSFTFDTTTTSQNALNPGASGNSLASFLLGYPTNASTTQLSLRTAGGLHYRGYFANDTWQLTKRITLTAGVRWEVPGVWTERYNRLAVFDPSEVNPLLTGITVNGSPVMGAWNPVGSSGHPERGERPETYTQVAPRAGVAWRLTDRTVVRAGAGLFFIPSDAAFQEGPYGNPVNAQINTMVATLNNEVTPLNTLSNPYPGGFVAASGAGPNFQSVLLGQSYSHVLSEGEKFGSTWQWNFTLQHQLPGGVAVEASYAGLRGLHLPQGLLQINELPDQDLALGSKLQQLVPNPFYGKVTSGALAQPTVQYGQLLLPFPEYGTMPDIGGNVGVSSYHSLQMKVEKRFAHGGTVLGAYTFSKLLTNVESLTTWLENDAAVQDNTNLRAEKSLATFDTRQRLIISYVVDLPLGRGQHFLSGVHGFTDKLVSGWGLNGVSTFQDGTPLVFTATPNLTDSFGGGLRPNVTAGCDKFESGPVQSRLHNYFNLACFSVPGAYSFGGEGRTDPNLRGPGIANYDLALFKRTALTERYNLEFRVEAFNLFNRVQFSNPNTVVTTAANPTTGWITAQANNPRLLQVSLRLRF